MKTVGRLIAAIGSALLLQVATARAQDPRAPDLTLTGTLTGAAHETYTEVPFKVPAGVERITVEFAYTGKAERSVIDLGLRDPERFRGWSGGNKSRFTLAESDATPSYLPGPLRAGTWRLVLGAPNIRKDGHTAYTARIWFDRKGEAFAGFTPPSVVGPARWWRGDLHVHTGHSDGSCLSRKGVKVACPVFKTLEAAATRGLDFIAITDHNATSQFGAMHELAPYFDDLLLIPGREITTFQGHANLFGPTAAIDFQLGSARAPTLATILDQAAAHGGLFSINHPGLPSGEICMGCGWTVKDVDYARVQAIEVVNGGFAEGPLSGLAFWEARLNEGWRITAIGGSDNHDATLAPEKAPAIGVPTTVVRAAALGQDAILDAIGRGHVFIDLAGAGDRILEVRAIAGEAQARMGEALSVAAGTKVRVEIRVVGVPGGILSIAGTSGAAPAMPKLVGSEATAAFELTAVGGASWLRVDVRGPDGRLLLLGNPIYLNPLR